MTDSKSKILDSIRRSVGRSAGAPVGQRPPILEPRRPGDREAEMECFVNEVNLLAGKARRLSADRLDAALQELVTLEHVKAAAAWQTPGLKALGLEERLRNLQVEIVPASADKYQLAACDLGVTEADFALPETGTLGLLSSPEKPRAISLLPRVHLAIIGPDALRADLHDTFALAKQYPYLILITGPSRTSDIELTLTLGVHGPKQLYVWMMG